MSEHGPEPRTAAGRALLGDVTLYGPNAEEVLQVILAIEAEAEMIERDRARRQAEAEAAAPATGTTTDCHEYEACECDDLMGQRDHCAICGVLLFRHARLAGVTSEGEEA